MLGNTEIAPTQSWTACHSSAVPWVKKPGLTGRCSAPHCWQTKYLWHDTAYYNNALTFWISCTDRRGIYSISLVGLCHVSKAHFDKRLIYPLWTASTESTFTILLPACVVQTPRGTLWRCSDGPSPRSVLTRPLTRHGRAHCGILGVLTGRCMSDQRPVF
jgi:hypothetical protein